MRSSGVRPAHRMNPDDFAYLGAGVLLGFAAGVGVWSIWRRGQRRPRSRRILDRDEADDGDERPFRFHRNQPKPATRRHTQR